VQNSTSLESRPTLAEYNVNFKVITLPSSRMLHSVNQNEKLAQCYNYEPRRIQVADFVMDSELNVCGLV
jgi:hypothetical protein